MTASWSRPRVSTAGLFLPDGAFYDEKAAERAVNFFERALVHVDGKWAGQPFKLQDWQVNEVIAPLFGYKRADDIRFYC